MTKHITKQETVNDCTKCELIDNYVQCLRGLDAVRVKLYNAVLEENEGAEPEQVNAIINEDFAAYREFEKAIFAHIGNVMNKVYE